MKAKLIKEFLNFERKIDPKKALKIGNEIFIEKLADKTIEFLQGLDPVETDGPYDDAWDQAQSIDDLTKNKIIEKIENKLDDPTIISFLNTLRQNEEIDDDDFFVFIYEIIL